MKINAINTEIIPLRLEVLSPIHIGSGEKISPLEYKIMQEEDNYYVYTVDYNAWLASLNSERSIQLANDLSSANMVKVWGIIKSELPHEQFLLSKSKTSKKSYDTYLNRLKSGTSDTELAISTRNPLNQAMILPGSSIKGAIRTAIIDWLDKGDLKIANQRDNSRRDKKTIEYERQLKDWFGDIRENAFQALKVADFEFLANESEFMEAIGIAKNPQKQLFPKGEVEVLFSHSPKYSRIILGRFAKQDNQKTPLERSKYLFENIALICNTFYKKRLKDEYDKFYSLPHFAGVRPFVKSMIEKIESLDSKKTLLLRVGHYSHVESVTVKNNAPQTPIKNNKPMPYGMTRTLANGKYPFGFILLHNISLEEYNEGQGKFSLEKEDLTEKFQSLRALAKQKEEKEQKLKDEQIKRAEEERIKREERLREQEEENRRKKEEEERKKQEKILREQEEEERKAKEAERLSSLSPLDRAIEKLFAKSANIEEVLQVYDKIDSLENNKELALLIKALWQKDKKWKPKDIKAVQKERVKKIQDIINS